MQKVRPDKPIVPSIRYGSNIKPLERFVVSINSPLTFFLILLYRSLLDDEESGDDEDVLSRQAIKMHAQQIIDSKNKKHKPRKNKRKTK